MKNMWKSLPCVVVFFSLFNLPLISVLAQGNKRVPDNCESMGLKLDVTISYFKKIQEDASVVVAIGALGKRETESANVERLNQVRSYFVSKGVKASQLLLSRSIQSSQYGGIQFVVDGRIIEEIVSGRNGRICWESNKI